MLHFLPSAFKPTLFKMSVIALSLAVSIFSLSNAASAESPNQMASRLGVHVQASKTNQLYMTFNLAQGTLQWITCGSTPTEEGCFASGQMGPYGHVCSVLQEGSTIYVVDSDAAIGKPNQPAIYAYAQTLGNGFNSGNKLIATIPVPVKGNAAGKCNIAATTGSLFLNVDKSTLFIVNRTTNALTSFAGLVPNSITTNNNFAVVSSSGSPAGIFYLFDTNGNVQEDGGQTSTTFIPGEAPYTP